MKFRGKDKTAVATFFTRYSSLLTDKIQDFANKNYKLPDTNKFITMIDDFIRNLSTPPPPNSPLAHAVTLLNAPNMRENADLMSSYLSSLITGIRVPAVPPPTPAPAALSAKRSDGAILANGSAASQAALTGCFGFTASDAAACANANNISASRLIGDRSTGVFYHNTIHSDTSVFGVKDRKDGIFKITCIYDQKDDHYYFVGIAKHDGTESLAERRDPVAKYKVQESLIPTTLLKGDTLRFR